MKYLIKNIRPSLLFCMLSVMIVNNAAAETNTTPSQVRDHRTESTRSQAEVRDHRRSETQLRLKNNQRLVLTNGSYIERQIDGTVKIIGMNGRVVRTFRQGKIVKDGHGEITLISGRKRMEAGVFKSIKTNKRASTQLKLKTNQRLLLTNGSYIERQIDGTVKIFEMNGRVVRSFPQGKIVKDERGGITILSGRKRMNAGVFKAIKVAKQARDHRRTTSPLGPFGK